MNSFKDNGYSSHLFFAYKSKRLKALKLDFSSKLWRSCEVPISNQPVTEFPTISPINSVTVFSSLFAPGRLNFVMALAAFTNIYIFRKAVTLRSDFMFKKFVFKIETERNPTKIEFFFRILITWDTSTVSWITYTVATAVVSSKRYRYRTANFSWLFLV